MGDRGTDAVVVGAGLAGLACALRLEAAGLEVALLEAAEAPGGRVRTDLFEGFRLDRGFQVLLTAYPEARRVLDYVALELRPFLPGALVRHGGGFHRVGDPLRRPQDAFATLRAGFGTLADKLRVLRLRRETTAGALDALLERPETTARERLHDAGFGDEFVAAFFRPFFGGILLDRELRGSSRMLDFVFRMLALGDTALPAHGMQAIPDQLAARLRPGTLRTRTRVEAVDAVAVTLDTGERLRARMVVVATEGPEAARLTHGLATPGSRGACCLYFAAERPPLDEPVLVLDGDGHGPVNNLCVPSEVAPSYAPAGASLVSATVVGVPQLAGADLERAVRQQLSGWFGPEALRWRHLRTYRIPHAQPAQEPPALEPPWRPTRLANGIHVCGDHRENASINGALRSGRRAAEALLAELGVKADRVAS